MNESERKVTMRAQTARVARGVRPLSDPPPSRGSSTHRSDAQNGGFGDEHEKEVATTLLYSIHPWVRCKKKRGLVKSRKRRSPVTDQRTMNGAYDSTAAGTRYHAPPREEKKGRKENPPCGKGGRNAAREESTKPPFAAPPRPAPPRPTENPKRKQQQKKKKKSRVYGRYHTPEAWEKKKKLACMQLELSNCADFVRGGKRESVSLQQSRHVTPWNDFFAGWT